MTAARSPGGELLAQLAGSVALTAICLPAEVDDHDPQLRDAAEGLGLVTTPVPRGDEDVLCALIADQSLEVPPHSLAGFERLPFLVLLGQWATAAADALLIDSAGWLAIDQPPPGAELVAPIDRALAAAELPGEWRAASPDAAPLGSDHDALSALWLAAERDHEALGAIADRIELSARRLDEARRAREQTSAEVARLREAERRELDRMRLALLEQRAWVADQAMRVAASQSWRVGHRLVRIGRLLAFKRDRGTDLPSMIARRMEDGDFR